MKRAVAQQLDQLKAKLNGYVALLVYRYANLCVEANPIALLPVEVEVEGEMQRIEDVAKVAVQEKYHFAVVPNCEEDLYPLGKAIMKTHPEFKQEVKTLDGYDEGDPEGQYLYYTMPEVNKDRRNAMLQAVDGFYDECVEKMSKAEQDCTTQLAKILADSSPAEQEKTAGMVKQIVDQFNDMRDQNKEDKKKEIEDAYAEYQAKQAEKEAQQQEEQQEKGNPMQMNLNTGN